MKYRYIVSILCASSVLSCANAQLPEGHFIINKALSESYKNFDESFKKQRSPLVFVGGNTADNCKSYFDMAAMYELDEAINNQLVKSEYLVCDALRILSASSRYTGNINISNIGQNVLSKLDLRSFPSSLYQASDEKSHTLASLYPEQVSSNENVAELNTQDWALTLEVVAVARINDNLANDWIVWLLDESKSGNYRNYQTFIIYDAEIQKSLKATPYP